MSYLRKVLYQNDQFEMVSCEWKQGEVSDKHGHGWSQCHVLIEAGIFENSLFFGEQKETKIFEAGQTIFVPMNVQHEIRCISETGETLNIYSPKIQEAEIKKFKAPSLGSFKNELSLGPSPSSLTDLLASLKRIENNSISTSSPYFMNQLFSGVAPESLLAEALISRTKTTMATFEAAPLLTWVENEVVQQLGQQIGWKTTQGISVPGGSSANFMALHCARNLRYPESKTKGMSGIEVQLFVSEEAHYSFLKAATVLGFGTDQVVKVKSDSQGRMIPQDLQRKIEHGLQQRKVPLFVCATAGTTVLGSFDPIPEISAICRKTGVWLHVDGAWGGPVLFSEKARELVRGIELADSMTFDAHKLFGVGMTCSFFLTSHPSILQSSNDVSGAEYLFHDEFPSDLGKLSWQCGRRADALSFWCLWKSQGTLGLGQRVDHLLDLKDQALVLIAKNPRLELVVDPEFLNICVRVLPEKAGKDPKTWSKYVREKMRDSDQAMVNYSTDAQGSTFLRLILANPRLELSHLQNIFEWALKIE